MTGSTRYRVFAIVVSGWGADALLGTDIGGNIAFFGVSAWDALNTAGNLAVAGVRITRSGNSWTINGATRANVFNNYVYQFGGITEVWGVA